MASVTSTQEQLVSSAQLTHDEPPSVVQVPLSRTTLTFSDRLAAGAAAGIVGSTIVYPVDIIKTTIQSSSSTGRTSIASATRNAARSIFASGGATGFYRGFGACLVGIIPEKSLKLAVNDASRDFLTAGQDAPIQMHQEITAGVITGFLQLFVTVPYEAVKIRLQMQGMQPVAQQKSALKMLRSMGPTGMYRGFSATFMRDVPFCMIFFPVYANAKTLLQKYATKTTSTTPSTIDKEPFHVGFGAGLIAGGIAGVTVTPFDMIKTRIQQGINGNEGFLEYTQKVARKEGFTALYRGWHTRLAIIAPLYGIVSLSFELQKQWLTSDGR